MTLTKSEIIQVLVDNVGLNKREAADLVEAFFEEIGAALEAGEDVKLSGFGGFQLRTKAERPGRNPKTGEERVIKARRVVTFHASQNLKQAVSGVTHTATTPHPTGKLGTDSPSRERRGATEPA